MPYGKTAGRIPRTWDLPPELRLVRPGQEDICSEYSESPWFYEVAEIAMILALKDYDACYAALKKTRQVVTVLEAAREDAQLGF